VLEKGSVSQVDATARQDWRWWGMMVAHEISPTPTQSSQSGKTPNSIERTDDITPPSLHKKLKQVRPHELRTGRTPPLAPGYSFLRPNTPRPTIHIDIKKVPLTLTILLEDQFSLCHIFIVLSSSTVFTSLYFESER
jgi:hypothetical protein